MEITRWIVLCTGAFLILGTVINLSNCSHWFVRGWDFPRTQIAALLLLCAVAGFWLLEGSVRVLFPGACLAGVVWHLFGIVQYTPLLSVQVKKARRPPKGSTFKLVATNVLMENNEHELWLRVVRDADADIILAAEVNGRWENAMAPLRKDYPHVVSCPLENMYGMMLLSRLELRDPETRFLVQKDVPSIHTHVRLPDGSLFMLRGIHPRPPEPQDDQDSTPRDAELVIVGREVDAADEPTVVAGDLNDVAWSHTTRLFQRVSGTLDPRVGRGFVNTYNAHNLFMRWPLDHVFHTEHFELVQLRRLPYVGSDHFPILIELALVPRQGSQEQEAPEQEEGDASEAREFIEREKNNE